MFAPHNVAEANQEIAQAIAAEAVAPAIAPADPVANDPAAPAVAAAAAMITEEEDETSHHEIPEVIRDLPHAKEIIATLRHRLDMVAAHLTHSTNEMYWSHITLAILVYII